MSTVETAIARQSGRASNRVMFAIVFLIVNMHLLRNLSLLLYVALYVPMLFYITVEFVTRAYRRQLPGFGHLFIVWITFAVIGFLVSLMLISPLGAVMGLARFLFGAPIFMALVLYTRNADEFRGHLSTLVYFFAISSLSLPLQFLVGPISWFAEASQRAGLERYSSLIGSLTSIGVIVGSYLVLVHGVRSKIKILLIVGMILPAVVSLNKSAMVNIAIAILGLVFLNRRSLSRFVIFSTCTGALLLSAYSLVPVLQERVEASLQSFGLRANSNSIILDDVSLQSSALDRLIDLPLANFRALSDLHSPLSYLLGGGYGMGNTALVPQGDALAPMAHNQYAEAISVFGFIGGSVLIVVIFRIQFSLVRRWRESLSPVFGPLAVGFSIFMLNSLFANGTLYQPAAASFFFLAMFAASSVVLSQRVTQPGVAPPVV